ncbi:Rib/alpha-like domain-containing protein, partial [Streptococcus sp. HMSC034E03]|uniref:Rib/alpha-like domain-containing protein n=1 Tax=Streptococcus sp. HMSC034E03 TaxID=1739309 RepID=UPI0011D12217
MDKKSSMSRIERQKREKVLRFSIRKYSFGAASVAVAALMFLGARVVSADSVTPVDQPHVEALTQDTSPLASQDKKELASSVKVDTATASQLVAQIKDQLHVKETANADLLVTAKEELVKAEQTLADSKVSQEEVDALVARLTNVLDQLRAVEVSQGKEDKNGESTQEATPEIKPEVAKPTPEISAKSEETSENTNAEQLEKAKASLKLSIEHLEQTIAQTPENDLTREILEKAIAQVAVAKSAFGGVEVSLRDVEDMNRVIKRNESSVMIARNRLTSGSHDPRNGQSMGQGTGFRANGQINQGALTNIKYFASVDPKENGGQKTINDNPEFTKNKTDIKATYVQDSEGKWIVYDVFFNNDGKRMTKASYQQEYYFQAPFNIMHSSNTVKDLSFTRYQNTGGRRLSDGFQGFTPYGNTAYIPTSKVWEQNYNIFNGDKRTIYDPSSGVTRDNQRWSVFKNNEKDPVLNTLTKNKNGGYPGASYYFGVKTGQESSDYAMHMHAKVRLRDDVTAEEAAQYGRVYAASVTYGRTTNQSYIMGATGTSLQADPEAPKDPIQGLTVTKTVGDYAGDPINPVSSGYVKHGKDGTFPSGMSWSWAGDNSPSTAQAGVFKYTSIATYKDGSKSTDANSGSDGTVTLIVKPKKPAITTDVANKKGLTGQQITVNVGSGVPNGSTVNLYDGDTVIGTGTTNGETATVTVTGALPGKPITAATVVNNGGTVTSDKSEPVTPTEAPDTQAPTLEISPAKQTVVEGQTVTFTVTARDDKHVNLNADDFTTKYGSRLVNSQASATNVKDTDTEKVRTITITTTAEDVGKTNTITFKATDNAGNKANDVTFTFEVTPSDKIPPTIAAESATVTKNEPITPIPVTAVDNTGGVGMRDNNPIEVSNLPQGLKYEKGQITGTTNAKTGYYTVKIKAYDKNNNASEKSIRITVQDQADKYNPTGDSLTVNQGQAITDEAVKAKVQNFGPGTLTVESKPTSTATAGDAGNAVVKVTYPDGSSDTVNVPVTVKDVTGPTITAESATVTKNEPITPIPVTAVDNTGGVGMRDNNPIQVSNLPQGLKYENGQITGTTNAKTGFYTVKITAYDKNNTPSTKTIRITVQDQTDKYNPTGETLTVPYNHNITDDEVKAKVQNFGPGTLTVESKPSTKTSGNVGNAVVKVTYPDGSHDTVNVPVVVGRPNKDDYTPKYDDGSGKPGTSVEIPVKEANGKKIPDGTTYTSGTPGITVDKDGKVTVTIPADKTPGEEVTGKVLVRYPDGSEEEVPVKVTVTSPETPVTEKPGKIEIDRKPNGDAIVTPKKPDG